jgi:hypothetical protein
MIKNGYENEKAFKNMWQSMKIDPNSGLYREILTKPVEAEDSKFNTFNITSPSYSTFINVGIWKDLSSFDAAVGKYIQAPEKRCPLNSNKEMLAVYREKFEFKIRERIILEKIQDRMGGSELPEADLLE